MVSLFGEVVSDDSLDVDVFGVRADQLPHFGEVQVKNFLRSLPPGEGLAERASPIDRERCELVACIRDADGNRDRHAASGCTGGLQFKTDPGQLNAHGTVCQSIRADFAVQEAFPPWVLRASFAGALWLLRIALTRLVEGIGVTEQLSSILAGPACGPHFPLAKEQ